MVVDCLGVDNFCFLMSCNLVMGVCNLVFEDDMFCDDDMLCNGMEICLGGVCQSGILVVCFIFMVFCIIFSCEVSDGQCYEMVVNDCCGNFLMEVDEQCDDGNGLSGDGCVLDCQLDCVNIVWVFINMDVKVEVKVNELVFFLVYFGIRFQDSDVEGGNVIQLFIAYVSILVLQIKVLGVGVYQMVYVDLMNDLKNWFIREGITGCGSSVVFESGYFLCKLDICIFVYVGRIFLIVGDYCFVYDV